MQTQQILDPWTLCSYTGLRHRGSQVQKHFHVKVDANARLKVIEAKFVSPPDHRVAGNAKLTKLSSCTLESPYDFIASSGKEKQAPDMFCFV